MPTPLTMPIPQWTSYRPADQAALLRDLAQQEVIGGRSTRDYRLQMPFTYLRVQARNVAEYLLSRQPGTSPQAAPDISPRPVWRWENLSHGQQRLLLRQIAEWSVHEGIVRRELPPEIRKQFRDLGQQAFAVRHGLASRRAELTR